MRRPFRRSVARAAIGLVAAAALAAGFGPAASAFAEDGAPLPVAITGQSHVDLSLQSDHEDSDEPQVTLRLAAPGSDEPGDDGVIPVVHQGSYTIKIDASGLAGVAAVKLPCAAKGLTAVCDGYEINAGERYNEIGDIRLAVDADSAAGDFGTIKVTGEGEGVDFTPLTIDVLVGGPELLGRKLSEPKGFAAGDTYEAPVGFRNVGGMAADGTVLHVHGSRGLSFPDSYGNCAYKQTTDGSLLYQGTDVICTFPGTYKAGAAYALSEPLKVKTAEFALYDIVNYGFSAVGAQKAKALMEDDGYTPGTGAPLTLEELPGAAAGDYARYAEVDLPSGNTYDFVLTGASAQGKAGDTVKAEIGFRNDGPAWISSLRSGGEPIMFTVAIPEGAKVTKAPTGCGATTIGKGVKGYLCGVETPLLEHTKVSFPFELRIDEVVKNARGKVALPELMSPNEADHSNNTAWIVLNGTGDDNAGGDGSQGSSGGPSATPSPTASDDDTSGSAGASGSGGASSSGGDSGADSTSGTGGGLALTGAGGALLFGGSGLLALGLGAVIVVVVRRRNAAA